ncbi:MAG: BREX-6 system phosphatase PglZ [Myxococcales bacterium]|nr:BREX-6 system phosphatase PglZ [Myxococcales bacterium]
MRAEPFAGPVSAALEADLRANVRRQGVVVWLDLDAHYSGFVDALMARDDLPYEVRAFRGSYLALMLALEGVAGGVEKAPLVVHLPGLNEESVRDTPIYELYRAGTRYRKALDTLVTEAAAGRVRPEQIDAFKARAGTTLEAADLWLASLLTGDDGGLPTRLRALSSTTLVDDLLGKQEITGLIAFDEHALAALAERFGVLMGLPADWLVESGAAGNPRAEGAAFRAASWALRVEYANDLTRDPADPGLTKLRALPKAVIDACRELAAHLRERHAPFYQRTADETEALLGEEVDVARAEDLGKVDTFRFEEDRVYLAALAALGAGDWDAAAAWAVLRVEPKPGARSFWLGVEPSRVPAWELVLDAARLGQRVAAAGEHLGAKHGLESALDAYVQRGAAVDQAHRRLEQARAGKLVPQLPHFAVLRGRLDGARAHWRRWADTWARDFSALCRSAGFLPPPALQQRTLFDEVVRPMTQEPGVTAFFVVDALRYEMGEELYRELAGTPATTVQLRARFAELPTLTEVGMNVLAPVAAPSGRLAPALEASAGDVEKVKGFSTGEYRVHDPATRQKAMHARVGGATCPWLTLDEVESRDAASLKRAIAQARLVVVHSQEIDAAGEKGLGPKVFATVLRQLRTAWSLLRDAGVRRFVITSDHGFLLLDDATNVALAHGRRIDPHRRHVFSPVAADHAGETRVALSELGYEGATGYVMFPESLAVFDTGKHPRTFVHGGNSLEERVIPVLTLVHRAAAGGSLIAYRVVAERRDGVAGMHCLSVRVEVAAQGALDFGGTKTVELALRVTEVPEVEPELCQARGGHAKIVSGAVQAAVGEPFELFFRLTGASDARVLVEVYHPSATLQVAPSVPEARFAVTAVGGQARTPAQTAPTVQGAAATAWLEKLDGAAQTVFSHLQAHGTLTEDEVAKLLGGARQARKFAVHFEEFAAHAPFVTRIDVVGGVKRYTREGGSK